jgi:hypothetical protein
MQTKSQVHQIILFDGMHIITQGAITQLSDKKDISVRN